MYLTLTCNPAIDWMMRVRDFSLGATNRSSSDSLSFGGKGVNVSTMLHRFGCDTRASGFIAGVTGDAIENGLENIGVKCDFVKIANGTTRINVKLKETDGEKIVQETEINGAGPKIPNEAIDEFFEKAASLGQGDWLVCSGSLAEGCPPDMYAQLLNLTVGKDIRCVVDTTGQALLDSLPHHPFLIKPNNDELAEFTGCDPKSTDELVEAARQFAIKGARYVLVSRGAQGAILVDGDGLIASGSSPSGKLVNSVGAGDSMVAGFLWGLSLRGSNRSVADGSPSIEALANALACGLASGSATAFTEALATKEQVEILLPQIEVQTYR